MKTSLESIAVQAFKNKRFVASEFHDAEDMVYDIFDQEACQAGDLVGKKITKVELCHMENDVGLALTFKGVNDPIFFYATCNITVED